MRDRNKQALIKKLIKCLPRSFLEELSGLESPWHSDRANLEVVVYAHWNDGETKQSCMDWINRNAQETYK